MKSWPWRMILGSTGGLLIFIGVTPIAYLLWFGTAHNFEPLSAPLSLKRGEYTSALFKTDLDEDYQVEIYFLPYHRSPLDLDWKIAWMRVGCLFRAVSTRKISTSAEMTRFSRGNTGLNVGRPTRSS